MPSQDEGKGRQREGTMWVLHDKNQMSSWPVLWEVMEKNTLFPAGVPKTCSLGTSPCVTHWLSGLSWQCQGNFSHVIARCQITPCSSSRSLDEDYLSFRPSSAAPSVRRGAPPFILDKGLNSAHFMSGLPSLTAHEMHCFVILNSLLSEVIKSKNKNLCCSLLCESAPATAAHRYLWHLMNRQQKSEETRWHFAPQYQNYDSVLALYYTIKPVNISVLQGYVAASVGPRMA